MHLYEKRNSPQKIHLSLRGGDLGPISSDALAKTFGVLAIGDAVAGTVAPIEVWNKFGIKVEPKSKGEHYTVWLISIFSRCNELACINRYNIH